MTPMAAPTPTRRKLPRLLLLIAMSVAVGLLAITRQSLWMDEGSTAFKALLPTLKEWWSMTLRLGGSDTQMPVYMFLLWVWTKCGALSEFALRAVNLPWLVVSVLALRRVRFWPLVCLTSPFVLYYVGELRPYAMQIAGGALAAAALGKVMDGREKGGFGGLHAAAGASLLLASSSLTAAVWAAGLWTGVLIIRPDWPARKGFWLKMWPWIVGMLLVAGYYGFTLIKGYHAGGVEAGGMLSMCFGLYEMLGLLGLGPGRNELRSSPATVVKYLPILLPALACIAAAWVYGVRTWLRVVPRRHVVAVLCAVVLPVLLLAVVGLKADFRVLGRHLSPAIPVILLPLAACVASVSATRFLPRLLGALAVVFWIASSIGLRVLERHARDDYRRATDLVLDALAQGKTVWWQADMNATRYYAYRKGGMPLVNAIQILESEAPTSLMFADIVFINRPDLRYRHVNYQEEMRRNSFKMIASFTGFEVWSTR